MMMLAVDDDSNEVVTLRAAHCSTGQQHELKATGIFRSVTTIWQY